MGTDGDAYGSRFGVAAPIRTGDGPNRWYLWDIDACGHQALTVHSRYHDTSAEVVADWEGGVGNPASDGAVFTPLGDAELLGELLPRELDMMRSGGENAEQFAEYHRSKRLAAAVIDASTSNRPHQTEAVADLHSGNAAVLFEAWLRQHRPDRSRRAGIEESIDELACSWHIGEPASLDRTCSPYRVALAVEHIRDYFEEDFAADLITLLPDWIQWLAEYNAIAVHLADRCRPYAHGEPNEASRADDGGPDVLARVAE